jgi:hypothetical protein
VLTAKDTSVVPVVMPLGRPTGRAAAFKATAEPDLNVACHSICTPRVSSPKPCPIIHLNSVILKVSEPAL